MARISGISLKQQPEQPTLSVRKTIDFMNEFSDFAGEAYAAIQTHLDSLGMLPADGPFVCFHNTDLKRLDVEAGFPVAIPTQGADLIAAGTIPSFRVATAIDQGPYEQQDPTLMELFDWIKQNGLEMAGPIYYHYLNETDRPENLYLTKMVIPVK